MTNSIISRAAFGDKLEDQDEFVSLIREAVEVSSGLDLDDLFPSMKLIHKLTGLKSKVEKIHKRVDKILDNVVRKHQEKRGNGNKSEIEKEDLMDVLLRVQQSGSLDIELTINDIKAVIWAVDGERTGKRKKKKKKEDMERERFIEGERKYLDQVW
ncbi:hypothetical protein P8452_46037 [Trifolium repens]|nr:hypothetical protein P8452_46037 [Trifolium repens]